MVSLLHMIGVWRGAPWVAAARAVVVCGAVGVCLPSCYIVKDAPTDPFIVSYAVKNKTFRSVQESVLVRSLANQNDLFIRQKNVFGVKTIVSPPIFDSAKVENASRNMKQTLAYNGYFHPQITYTIRKKIKKTNDNRTQQRVFVKFVVQLGEPIYFQGVSFAISPPAMGAIVTESVEPHLDITPGDIFSTTRLDALITGIVERLHEHGYVHVSHKHFDYYLDTLVAPPRAVARSRRAPTKKYIHAKIVTVPPAAPADSAQIFKQYYLRNAYFLPNHQDENLSPQIQFEKYGDIYVDKSNVTIRPFVLEKMYTIRPKELFSQARYDFSIKRFLQTNIWSAVRFRPRYTTDTFIGDKTYGQFDILATMVENKRYNVNAEVGLSFNTTPRTLLFRLPNRTLASNVRAAFTVRNVLRTGMESQIVLRAGVETFVSLEPRFSVLLSEYALDWINALPWLMPVDFLFPRQSAIKQTYVNFSVGFTDRLNFYNLRHGAFSYVWRVSLPERSIDFSVLPVQMFITRLHTQQAFKDEQKRNPSLVNAFSQGLVAGVAFVVNKAIHYRHASNHSSVLRLSFEESGASWGNVLKFVDQSIYQYLRFDFTFVHYIQLYKSTLAYRWTNGVGFTLDNSATLPFFKQFFVGGPNSMRAWNATRLGFGSSPLIEKLNFKDRYGDIKLETNLEYRMNLLSLSFAVFEGAVFTDIGNIWTRTLLADEFPGSVFTFRHLLRDIAVAVGAGLRLNSNFLVLRVDLGVKLKDPVFPVEHQWLNPRNWQFKNMQVQIGLGYPF